MSDDLIYLLITYYLLTYTALFIIFHGNSNPGTNPGIPGLVFHNPEIPGLEKGSGIASPTVYAKMLRKSFVVVAAMRKPILKHFRSYEMRRYAKNRA